MKCPWATRGVSIAMALILCPLGMERALFRFEAKFERYDLANIYTLCIGPYERFALEAPPD